VSIFYEWKTAQFFYHQLPNLREDISSAVIADVIGPYNLVSCLRCYLFNIQESLCGIIRKHISYNSLFDKLQTAHAKKNSTASRAENVENKWRVI
jgi:hypothetical protein